MSCTPRFVLPMLVTVLLLGRPLPVVGQEKWAAMLSPQNSVEMGFTKDGQPVLRLALAGWGPNWVWVGVNSKDKTSADKHVAAVPFVVNKAAGQVIDIRFSAWRSGPRELTFVYDMTAAKDVPVTMVIAGISIEKSYAKGSLILTRDGQDTAIKLPLSRGAHPATGKAVLRIEQAGDIALSIDPPCPIALDGDMRIMLASEVFSQGHRNVTIKATFPEPIAMFTKEQDMRQFTKVVAGPDWFAFNPTNDLSESVISMNDWMDKPAGKRGGVRMANDRFQFEDGTPVRFWGANLSYGGACAPPQADADFMAARFAKYGVNGVRLHKFSYPKNQMGIGDPLDATRMDAQGLDRLDYFSAQLKKNGVYFGWSHTFGFHVSPGNRSRLLAYDEIEKNLKNKTYAFINFAEDVQDLMIEMVVNLLKHRNPHTGLNYADEPALSFIELQNEDDIFFYTSTNAFNACPTYRKHFISQFCAWLTNKYKTEEGLKKAWGNALTDQETLAAKNIVPQTNPWYFSDAHLPSQKGGQRQRLLDTAAWLHDKQNAFYERFVRAIRDAGYKGPICGSPWQAPSMLPHYYNLRSDYLAGYIDRHNYFGGHLNDTMLGRPGSGYFSTGLQQVIDRPFGLSEWIHVYPSLYSAEGPAIIAAYGMGLQGWDASYQFQSQPGRRAFGEIVGRFPWGVWEVDVPTQLGQYPALSRMVLRGDVKESAPISVRRVNVNDLAAATFDFADKVEQQGDVKNFSGSVPPEALAVGRLVVEFTDKPTGSTFVDMAGHRHGTAIDSVTGELSWDTAGGGLFTVNTEGTKAVVGFGGGRRFNLGNVSIEPRCPYSSIVLTAIDRNSTLGNARAALLTVLARNCNTGFSVFTVDSKVIENGKAPIMLEPVRATIGISGRGIAAVNILDHDGKRTGRTIPAPEGKFAIDGATDKAIYYEVVFR